MHTQTQTFTGPLYVDFSMIVRNSCPLISFENSWELLEKNPDMYH